MRPHTFMNIWNSPALCFSRPQRPMLWRRVRGHEGEVLLCHGHKGPAARLAVSYSGCSSPSPPPLPLLPLPLLPTRLLLPLVLYSSFLSPSSLSASSSLFLSSPSPPPFPFSLFSPPSPPLAIRRNQRLFHTHFSGAHTNRTLAMNCSRGGQSWSL